MNVNTLDLKNNAKFSKSIEDILLSLKLLQKRGKRSKHLAAFLNLSVAVIDLSGKKPIMGGYNMEQFIYPASLYKVFIAAEVLRQAENSLIKLDENISISAINAVDKRKQIPYDDRNLLRSGDKKSARYLLDLMLSRSDNTAANCLIDLVGRENINKNIIKKFGWRGSEVTRKFLPRKFENKKWKKAPITLSCAKHIAEFFFMIEKGRMISQKASLVLKELLLSGGHFESENIKEGLTKSVRFYRKGGWFNSKLKDGSILKFNSDAGIVEDGEVKYVIAILTSLKNKNKKKNFPMRKLSRKIYNLISAKNR